MRPSVQEVESQVIKAFDLAAQQVPAYRTLLEERGLRREYITNLLEFRQLPTLSKLNTFQRFEIDSLCREGKMDGVASVLTSSGHSGPRSFAFGISDRQSVIRSTESIDDLLDFLFQVRCKPTLLINCLPMGVRVYTQECTLAETSVRPDMLTALVRAFGKYYSQIILVGETAFIKAALEQGRSQGIRWPDFRVHIIVGEEILAENARAYLEQMLGIVPGEPDSAVVVSSMGVAEIGLNLFSEAPPLRAIIDLRRALHSDRELRVAILGKLQCVPSIFTYDERRIFVEFDSRQKLLVTTLDPGIRLPLIRYETGDVGAKLELCASSINLLKAKGLDVEYLQSIPLVLISGRGNHVLGGGIPLFPEEVKEGVYFDLHLAAKTTANFRISAGPEYALIRIQLSQGIEADDSPAGESLAARFKAAIRRYTAAPIEVRCESYELFGDGMTLDYERKFNYIDAGAVAS